MSKDYQLIMMSAEFLDARVLEVQKENPHPSEPLEPQQIKENISTSGSAANAFLSTYYLMPDCCTMFLFVRYCSNMFRP
jgi:hypothetical protein